MSLLTLVNGSDLGFELGGLMLGRGYVRIVLSLHGSERQSLSINLLVQLGQRVAQLILARRMGSHSPLMLALQIRA